MTPLVSKILADQIPGCLPVQPVLADQALPGNKKPDQVSPGNYLE
jgi:hypothetical protein